MYRTRSHLLQVATPNYIFAQFIFRLKWANNCKGWQRDKENAVNDCIMKSQITNTILTTLNYIEEIFCNTGTKQIKATLLTLGPLSLGVINTFTIQKRRKYIACMYSKDDRGISQICAPLWGQVTLHASAMGVQQHQHRVVMWINSKHQTQLSTTSHVLFAMKRYLHTFAQQQIVMWARRLCVIKTSFVNSFEIFMIFLLYQQYHLNTFSTSLSLSLYFLHFPIRSMQNEYIRRHIMNLHNHSKFKINLLAFHYNYLSTCRCYHRKHACENINQLISDEMLSHLKITRLTVELVDTMEDALWLCFHQTSVPKGNGYRNVIERRNYLLCLIV